MCLDCTEELANKELQRTSDGNAAGSPLNSVFGSHSRRKPTTGLSKV